MKYIFILGLLLSGCSQKGISFDYINADEAQTSRLDCMFGELSDVMGSNFSADGTVTIVPHGEIVGFWDITKANGPTESLDIRVSDADNTSIQVLAQGLVKQWGSPEYQEEVMNNIFKNCK